MQIKDLIVTGDARILGNLGVEKIHTNNSDITTPQIREIYAGTTDLTAGSTPLPTGTLYFVYE